MASDPLTCIICKSSKDRPADPDSGRLVAEFVWPSALTIGIEPIDAHPSCLKDAIAHLGRLLNELPTGDPITLPPESGHVETP